MSDKDLNEIYSNEDKLKDFIIGAAVSAISMGSNTQTYKNIKNGKSLLTDEDINTNNPNILPINNSVATGTQQTTQNNKINLPIKEMTNTQNSIYQFNKTDNTKINNLRSSASKYFNNTEATQNLVSVAEKLVNDKGYNITFDNNITDKNGNIADGVIEKINGEISIRLNPNSERAGEFLLIHEMTHAIETPEIRNFIQNFAEKNPEYSEAIKGLETIYESTEITGETVADISANLFGNQEFINSLAMDNSAQAKTIIQKIYEAIKSFLNSFTKEGREKNFVSKLEKMWREAYRNTTIKQALNNVQNAKFHLSENAMTEVNDALNNPKTDINSMVKLRDFTPEQLVSVGVSDLPMLVRKGHLRENILTITEAKNKGYSTKGKHYHGLGIDTYMKAIDSLDNPIAVYRYTDKGKYSADNFIVLTEIKDSDNNNIIVPIEIHQKGQYNKVEIDINRIKTTYGRETTNYFENMVKDGNLIEVYKKGSTKLPMQSGNFSTSDENNIPRSNTKVNSDTSTKYSMPLNQNNTQELDNSSFSIDNQGRKLSKEQQEYFKNSKVRDENGNLKVLYHGTPFGDFTTFKGDMFFFSENYKFAEDYAESKSFENGLDAESRVVEAYLKAEKVFDVTNQNDIQKLREALSDEINYWGKTWDKETLLKKLQRKDTLPPKWKSEQIENKKFGDYIGDDRSGYNNDMFIGVNEQNEIVYIANETGLNKLPQEEKDSFQKQLIAGKEVVYETYKTDCGELTELGIHEKINELQKLNEEYKKENGVEDKHINYYIEDLKDMLRWIEKDIAPKTKHKLIPRTTTKESTELTDIDNWSYFETAFDTNTRKDIVEIIKDLGYDAINIYENGISNYLVFNSNQIKNVDNTNPTTNDDIRYSKYNQSWQEHLDKYYKPTGTRTDMSKIKIPTANDIKLAKGNIPINENLLNKYSNVKDIFSNEKNNYDGNVNVKSEISELKYFDIDNTNITDLKKMAKDIFIKYNQKNIFENNGNKIVVNKSGINESIEKIYNNRKQRNLAKEHLLVFSDLGDIIENATLVNQTPELKNRENIKPWNYYFDGLKINGELYHLEFDVRSMASGENQYRVQRLEKITKKTGDYDGDTSNKTSVLPPYSQPVSYDNNIPQFKQTVKSDISNNNIRKDIDVIPLKKDVDKSANVDTTIDTPEKLAEILKEKPTTIDDRDNRLKKLATIKFIDKGYYVDKLARSSKNKELSSKYDYSLLANGIANNIIGNGRVDEKGNKIGKGLYEIFEPIENSGLLDDFSKYIYHKHNVDRMNLTTRYAEENKAIFGDSVTSEVSEGIVKEYETKYPEFEAWAQDIYKYNQANLEMLVKYGVLSSDSLDYYNKKYPHYVPTIRDNAKVKTQMDIFLGKKAKVNNPIKRAKGGNSDIIPLKDAMALRTMQTVNSALRNNFGLELMDTIEVEATKLKQDVDSTVEEINFEDLLTERSKENPATLTVFQNGEKVTFAIPDEIYEALKPSNIYTSKALNKLNNIRRGLLTEYNPTFMVTNPLKDIQDGSINSKHPITFPKNLIEATNQQAWLSAGISAGAEIGSEYLFGGVKLPGTGKTTGTILDKVTSKIKNNALKYITQAGINIAGEGAEEVISGIGSALGKQATYMSDKELNEIYSNEDKLKDFIIGAAVSAISMGSNTQTYKNIKNGKSLLTDEDINTNNPNILPINNSVARATQNNKINLPIKEITNTQNSIYQFNKTDNTKINNLRSSASKYFNNTEATQNLVSVAEKLVNDKGYNITFDNNILDKSGNIADGVIEKINGEISIRLNPNSERAGEFLLVHEMTHAIETPEIRNFIQNFAEKNPEYSEAIKGLETIYESTEITGETVADISANLFGNQEFINSLAMDNSTQAKNIIQKIYEAIKTFLNSFTKEGREKNFASKLEKMWREAYITQTNNIVAPIYSKGRLSTGEDVVISDDINGSHPSKQEVEQNLKSMLGIKYVNSKSGTEISIENKDIKKYLNDGYNNQKNTRLKKRISGNYGEILEIAKIDTSKSKENYKGTNRGKQGFDYYNVALAYPIKNTSGEIVDYKYYEARLVVRKDNNNNFAYDLDNFKEKKGAVLDKTSLSIMADKSAHGSFNDNNIPHVNTKVNSDTSTKYSMPLNQNNTQELDNSSFSLEQRLSGDELLNAQDLIEEIKSVGANVDENGYVTLYHQTTNENADKIKQSGKMVAKEPWIYFSTSKNASQADGRGTTKLEFKIPAEKLILDDIFENNADVKIKLNSNKELDISNYIVNNAQGLDNSSFSIDENLSNLSSKELDQLLTEISNKQDELRRQLFLLRGERKEIIDSIPNYSIFEDYNELKTINTKIEDNRNKYKEIYQQRKKIEEKINTTKEQEKAERIAKEESIATPHKLAQNKIIQETNPMLDDYHGGIRSVGDILSWQEAVEYADKSNEGFGWGDFNRNDAEKALKRGTIDVYSSYPIKNGVFVSTSYQQALDYAGGNPMRVHHRTVALDSVAWIDVDEGQYAKVTKEKYSKYSQTWQEHLDKYYKPTGTRTDMSKIKIPTANDIKLAKGNIPINENLLNKYSNVKDIFSNERNNYDGNVNVKNVDFDLINKTATDIYHIAADLFSNNHANNVFINDGNKIIVTNQDIKESINKIYNDRLQKKYLNEHLSAFTDLGDIISNARLVNQTPEGKGREKYNLWSYYYSGLKINNELYNFEFDVVSRNDGENHYRLQRIEKADFQSTLPINGEVDLGKSASYDNNIPQFKQTVKSDISNNNIRKDIDVIPLKKDVDKSTNVDTTIDTPEKLAEILKEKPTTIDDRDNRLKKLATIKFIDKGYYVDKLARSSKNKELSSKYDYSLLANGIANNIIGNGRVDEKGNKIGKGLYEIFEPIENSGLIDDFSKYIYIINTM